MAGRGAARFAPMGKGRFWLESGGGGGAPWGPAGGAGDFAFPCGQLHGETSEGNRLERKQLGATFLRCVSKGGEKG